MIASEVLCRCRSPGAIESRMMGAGSTVERDYKYLRPIDTTGRAATPTVLAIVSHPDHCDLRLLRTLLVEGNHPRWLGRYSQICVVSLDGDEIHVVDSTTMSFSRG